MFYAFNTHEIKIVKPAAVGVPRAFQNLTIIEQDICGKKTHSIQTSLILSVKKSSYILNGLLLFFILANITTHFF